MGAGCQRFFARIGEMDAGLFAGMHGWRECLAHQLAEGNAIVICSETQKFQELGVECRGRVEKIGNRLEFSLVVGFIGNCSDIPRGEARSKWNEDAKAGLNEVRERVWHPVIELLSEGNTRPK